MSPQAFSQWQYLDPMGVQTGGVPGSASKVYPIRANGPEPWFRDAFDALSSARMPMAQYPDGYLATLNTKRQDRLNTGADRPYQNVRSYERGVHVGARVLPQAYFWDKEFHPLLGLQLQAEGKKFAPQGEYRTRLVNDGKAGPVRGAEMLSRDPTRRGQIPRNLHPTWR